ncbi:MAG: hypothetical protein LCH88_17450 [Proteobacteria bacterium]|nr:hypothetical protein [Pseudomonadota bacterium]
MISAAASARPRSENRSAHAILPRRAVSSAALAQIEAEWAAPHKGSTAGLIEAIAAEFERHWQPEANPFHVIPGFPIRVAAGDHHALL